MKLSKYIDWESWFSKDSLTLGKTLCRQGKAKKLLNESSAGSEMSFSATVRTDRNYRTRIRMPLNDLNNIKMSCSCGQKNCEHLAATMYLIEDYLEKIPEADSDEPEADFDEGDTRSAEPEMSSELTALIKRDEAERADDEVPDDSLYGKDGYRYFHPEEFENGLNINRDMRRKAEKLLKKGELGNFKFNQMLTSDQTNGTVLQVKAEFVKLWGSVEVVAGSRKILSADCQNWQCNHQRDTKSYLGYTLCVHEVALILKAEQYLKDHPEIGDETNYAAYSLIRRIGGKVPAGEEQEAAGQKTRHTLSPSLATDSRGEKLTVSFKFGDAGGKLYKVKNIPDFVSETKNRTAHVFSSRYSAVLDEDTMDESGLNWFHFMDDFSREENMHADSFPDVSYYGSSYYKLNVKDSIPLFGIWIDRFFDLILEDGSPVEFTGDYYGRRGKYLIKASPEPFKPELEISPLRDKNGGFAGVTLQGEMPASFPGQRNAYCIDDKSMRRVDRKSYDAVSQLTDNDGHIFARVGRSFLGDFYHKALPQLQNAVQITDNDREEIVRYLPPEAHFTFYLDALYGTAMGRVRASYGDNIYDPADNLYKNTRLERDRDAEAEERAVKLMLSYLPSYDPNMGVFFSKNEEELYYLVSTGVDTMMQYGEVRTTDRFKRLGVRRRIKVNVGVSLDSNLLDLKLTSTDVPEDELLHILLAYQMKKKYYRLKDGSFVSMEGDTDSEAARLSEMMDALQISPKDFVKGKMHIPAYRALYVDRMLEEMDDVYAERDTHFKALIRNFKSVNDSDDEVPKTLAGTLRRYQVTGYRWLRMLDRSGFGGILADDMGLGKTIQVIALLLSEKENGRADSISIVVCPASLVYNWEEEIHRFAPGLPVRTIAGTQSERRALLADISSAKKCLAENPQAASDSAENAEADTELPSVIVTSYDLLKRDIDAYDDINFRYAVIDEAQYIKNSRTAAAKSVKLLHAESRFALTGTPIENRLSELWSIFDFLMPGFLYGYETFRSKFETPIVKNEDTVAEKQLSRMVTPFVLRRLKKDVLKDLPDKIEEYRYFGLEKDQQKLYDAEVLLLRKKLEKESEDDFRRGKIEILSELTRIRQICCDPSLCFESYTGSSAKRNGCIDLIRSAVDGGHKMLIFSQFTSMLELLAQDLRKEDISFYRITGQTPKEKRTRMAEKFNSADNEVSVFLISLKAGGTGLNLTGADMVIHYDPWWNLAVQNQATDRAHRIGQTKVVNVYKLIARGTIEEKIVAMQEAKAKLSDNILSSEGISSASISRDELLELLGA